MVVADLADEKGKALEAELGVRYVRTDATDESDVKAAMAEAEAAGPLRISVDAHGGPASGGLLVGKDGEPLDLAGFRKTIDFYLTAVFNVMRLAAAAIARQEAVDGDRGVIVNTASIAAYEGQIGQIPYAAAKGGVVGMTLVAARDLSPLGIRVVTIAPGTFLTPAYGAVNDQLEAYWGPRSRIPNAWAAPRVRGSRGTHLRERLSQRRGHPSRRRPPVPAEVTGPVNGPVNGRVNVSGELKGKVAFVAGASRGIGRNIARGLAEAGAAVAVAARSEEEGRIPGTIHAVAERITSAGGRALAVACDVTSEASVEAAVAATVTEFGGIDILIANAGVMWLGPVESTRSSAGSCAWTSISPGSSSSPRPSSRTSGHAAGARWWR